MGSLPCCATTISGKGEDCDGGAVDCACSFAPLSRRLFVDPFEEDMAEVFGMSVDAMLLRIRIKEGTLRDWMLLCVLWNIKWAKGFIHSMQNWDSKIKFVVVVSEKGVV